MIPYWEWLERTKPRRTERYKDHSSSTTWWRAIPGYLQVSRNFKIYHRLKTWIRTSNYVDHSNLPHLHVFIQKVPKVEKDIIRKPKTRRAERYESQLFSPTWWRIILHFLKKVGCGILWNQTEWDSTLWFGLKAGMLNKNWCVYLHNATGLSEHPVLYWFCHSNDELLPFRCLERNRFTKNT